MAKRATITVQVDSTLKSEVEPIFQELGLTTTEAIDTFFRQVKRYHRLPFPEENLPNEETRQAIYEAEQGINLVVCEDADDLFKKLGI